MHLILHTDGGARGNPGPAGYGYVVTKVDNSTQAGIILRKCGNYCGETTNNQAEYLGLIGGLTWIKDNVPEVSKLSIIMDSLLIVNQVKGLFQVKNQALKPRHQEVMNLLRNFHDWNISHTLRSGNTSADALVNQAIDQKSEVVD